MKIKKAITVLLILVLSYLLINNVNLSQENKKLRIENGKSNIKGPGIIIRLQDGDSSKNIIHDTDLMIIINELWASQAKAISINGERIKVNTAIRCAGPSILINERAISSPFVIKAIGESNTLKRSLNITGGHVQTLKSSGSYLEIQEGEKIIVPKYQKSIKRIQISEI